MRKTLLLTGLLGFCALASNAVQLKVEPEKSVLQAGQNQKALIRISITAPAKSSSTHATPKVNLAIAFDRSGSMQGKKLEDAKIAAQNAVDLLNDGDIFSLVTYDNSAKTLVKATVLNDITRTQIQNSISQITASGSTALFAGVSLAAVELRKNIKDHGWVNRIILISDGQANVGPSSASELGKFGNSLGKESVSVSSIGLGVDYNEDVMTSLSQNSDGNFYFVENSAKLQHILEQELSSALLVAAQKVRVSITCPQGVKPCGILGHEATVSGQSIEIDFNQIYAGHDKVLILQVELPPQDNGKSKSIANVAVEYQEATSSKVNQLNEVLSVKFSTDSNVIKESINRDVRVDVAVQETIQARNDAITKADAGDYAGAKDILTQAAQKLRKDEVVNKSAKIKSNIDMLDEDKNVMEQSQARPSVYSNERKNIRGTNYQIFNDQVYQQKK